MPRFSGQTPLRRASLAFAAALAALTILAAAVIAAGGGPDPVVVENQQSPQPAAVEGPYEVGGPGASDVSVLQEPATSRLTPASADARPGSASALEMSLAGQGVTDSVPAHRVAPPLGEAITVAEVGEEVCVGASSLATCGSPEQIAEGRVLAVELCSPQLGGSGFRVLGMAPDGVEAITVETQGAPVRAPVLDNAYQATTVEVPVAIRWEGGARDDVFAAPVPPGYSPSECGG
jgi:hypothetical protein